ncbi:hypothetical protein [Nocardioides sp.]|uniref:hypothetical protein n=1 Tax=Nocardioides sp. TaxID=35761 RepID=UPI001A35C00D|nr:hypothetical protein [Nocardioides sp.]MBJ7356189.1 hypothetical protein [Nocardioides sp.]
MNVNSTDPNRPPRRARRGLVLGASAVAGVAMLATTAPVVAANLVDSKDLAKGAVTSSKIAKNAVKTNKLAPGAVKTKKIKDGAVTSSKLAAGAVTRNHLAADLQPLWAVVWGGPSIVRGKGAVAVEHVGVDSQFRVTFDRDVSQCSYTATPSQPDSDDPQQIGMLNVSSAIGSANSVIVRTRDHDGVAQSLGFTIHVWC